MIRRPSCDDPITPGPAPAAPPYPAALAALLETFDGFTERGERIQMLLDLAEAFREVPPEIAARPFDEAQRVPACESEAFAWGLPRADGRLHFHFAVENPQGVSARALASVLASTCSGAPLDAVAALDDAVVYRLFGRELSMGKTMGLTAMVAMVAAMARAQARA